MVVAISEDPLEVVQMEYLPTTKKNRKQCQEKLMKELLAKNKYLVGRRGKPLNPPALYLHSGVNLGASGERGMNSSLEEGKHQHPCNAACCLHDCTALTVKSLCVFHFSFFAAKSGADRFGNFF